MQEVYDGIIDKGKASPGDINRLMEAVGKPGQKRDKKREVIGRLFDELGVRSSNSQGYSVLDSLDSFGAW